MDLQEIIDQHYVAVRRTARVLTRDDWEADEVTQETFMAACRNLDSVRDETAVRAWLVSICVRIRRSRYRAAMRRVRHMTLFSQSQEMDRTCDDQPRDHADIWFQVRRLPARQSEVITLRYLHAMSLAEVAKVIGCSEGTVKSRLHHGLKRLRENDEFRRCHESS